MVEYSNSNGFRSYIRIINMEIEKTITFNSNQINFLLELLEYGEQHWDSETSQITLRQIKNKLLNE